MVGTHRRLPGLPLMRQGRETRIAERESQKTNRADSCSLRGLRSLLTCPNVLFDLISPEPQRRSEAEAPLQLEVVSKSAVVFTPSNDTWLKML